MGADHVIDYTKEDFTKNGQFYDLILDVKGFHSIFDYKRALSPKGIYIMMGGSSALVNQLIFLGPFISLCGSKKISLLLHKASKGMAFMKELLEADKVIPIIDRCYPLNKTAEALQYFAARQAKGKVLITLSMRTKPNNY